MTECKEVQYVVGKTNTLLQLMKNFGREKRVVVKYNKGFKYVHVYDNRKVVNKYPGITLGYDELLQLCEIVKLMDLADGYFKKVSIYMLFILCNRSFFLNYPFLYQCALLYKKDKNNKLLLYQYALLYKFDQSSFNFFMFFVIKLYLFSF
jgi:hypothetical protein